MANLINNAAFTLTVELAQRLTTDVAAQINGYITLYEPQFLQDVLGATLYADYLINPTTYASLVSNYLTKAEPYYIYWLILRDRAELAVGVGVASPTAENATVVSPIRKQVIAWNTMLNILRPMYVYLNGTPAPLPLFNRYEVSPNIAHQNEFGI